MSRQPINGEMVEVMVLGADGRTTDTALSPREVWTVEAVDRFLRSHSLFHASYPGATLQHVESMRGVEEHRQGRYYLRYGTAQGVAEFWGYLSRKQPTFDFKQGRVGVVATPDTPGP